MQVVILAGGKGSRLKSITESTPKSMVKINDVPFLEILIKNLSLQGFDNFILCTGYLENIIKNYFLDGSKINISITYSHEFFPLGTAGAIKNAHSLLHDEFLVFNGDTFLNEDFSKLIEFGRNCGSLCTIASLHSDDPEYKNNLYLSENNLVLDYDKDKHQPTCNFVDAGVYYMRKEILDLIPEKYVSLENDIFQKLIKSKQLFGYKIKSNFYDIGTKTRLEKFENFHKNFIM